MPIPAGWDSTNEPLCGEQDPSGRADTANRSARAVWQNLCAEHNQDGTHRKGGITQMIAGAYTSSAGNKVVALSNASLRIKMLWIILRGGTQPAVLATDAMPAGYAKLLTTAALQTNLVVALATPGQFTVGTANPVNWQGGAFVYDYIAIGVV